MGNSEQERYLRVPSSVFFPLLVVGFLALGGTQDLAEAAGITLREGFSTVLSDPKIGSDALFEIVWGSGQLVAAGLLNTLFGNPIGKIKFE